MIRKAIGIHVLAAVALAVSAGSSAGHGSDTDIAAQTKIATLEIELQKLQIELNRQRSLIDMMQQRAVRLTSECHLGQKCVLKEAVSFPSYDECKRSISRWETRSLCTSLFDHSSDSIPNSP
ncbi:hypothetical protein D3C71_152890 [compost metagenome]